MMCLGSGLENHCSPHRGEEEMIIALFDNMYSQPLHQSNNSDVLRHNSDIFRQHVKKNKKNIRGFQKRSERVKERRFGQQREEGIPCHY